MGRRPPGTAIADYQTNLGIALVERGDLKAAEPYFRDSLDICRKPTVPIRQTVNVLAAYGRMLIATGKLDAADAMLTESLSLRQAQFGKSHPVVAGSLLGMAALRMAQKRCGDAVPLSREALGSAREFLPVLHALTATAALSLARALQVCGNAAEARPLADEALNIRTQLMPGGSWQIGEARRFADRTRIPHN